MCPENAKVFVVEDYAIRLRAIKQFLEKGGHEVVLTASSLDEALDAVPKLNELGIQVATVDGNLTLLDDSGDDGRMVVHAIRDMAPEIKIVGHSSNDIGGVDANVRKGDVGRLAEVINKL